MNDESAVTWLAREVGDLLDVGSVGLYELMELLSGDDFDLTDEENREVALTVTRQILLSGRAELCRLKWPKDDVLERINDPGVLDARHFPAQASEYYLALMPR